MYEDRFGTEEKPILVPSLEEERIIGVTDPEDDNLVVRICSGPRMASGHARYVAFCDLSSCSMAPFKMNVCRTTVSLSSTSHVSLTSLLIKA